MTGAGRLLGYLDDLPVAWCSLAPFNTFHGSRKAADDEEHMGFVALFESAGFTEVAREGTRRHVRQRAVCPPRR